MAHDEFQWERLSFASKVRAQNQLNQRETLRTHFLWLFLRGSRRPDALERTIEIQQGPTAVVIGDAMPAAGVKFNLRSWADVWAASPQQLRHKHQANASPDTAFLLR